MRELRFDPVRGGWALISSERGHRPTDFLRPQHATTDEPCPFCMVLDGSATATVLGERQVDGDRVVTLANRFPALAAAPGAAQRHAVGPFDRVDGVGAHEVVVEGVQHTWPEVQRPPRLVAAALMSWRDRIADLYRDRRFHYVCAFKNSGPQACASLSHPHSQLVAMPMIPGRLAQQLQTTRRHYFDKERCLVCDVIHSEVASGERVVIESERFVAICPYASRHPFEVTIYPRHHNHDFSATSDRDAELLGGILADVSARVQRALSGADYNLCLHTAPSTNTYTRGALGLEGLALHWHWRLEFIPRTVGGGGLELGTGIHINPTPPEEAAAHLRGLKGLES